MASHQRVNCLRSLFNLVLLRSTNGLLTDNYVTFTIYFACISHGALDKWRCGPHLHLSWASICTFTLLHFLLVLSGDSLALINCCLCTVYLNRKGGNLWSWSGLDYVSKPGLWQVLFPHATYTAFQPYIIQCTIRQSACGKRRLRMLLLMIASSCQLQI